MADKAKFYTVQSEVWHDGPPSRWFATCDSRVTARRVARLLNVEALLEDVSDDFAGEFDALLVEVLRLRAENEALRDDDDE